MRIFRAFVLHEAKTQGRSLRFRIMAVGYVLLCMAPPLAVHLERVRADYEIGGATFAAQLFSLQPFLTALLAWLLAADALVRERDEGSFAVLGIAPLSTTTYVMARFTALALGLVIITALPPLGAYALAFVDTPPAAALPFVWPWALHVVPLCLSSAALSMGLGTILGGTVFAAIGGLLLFSGLYAIGNGILARSHFIIDGPGAWLGLDSFDELGSQVFWTLRGQGWGLTSASAAPPDLRLACVTLISQGAVYVALSSMALLCSIAFVRRTRADLRPWSIPPKSQVRTLLAKLNQIREELHPDRKLQAIDRLSVVAGPLLALALVGGIFTRGHAFRVLSETRYGVETGGLPHPTTRMLVPRRCHVKADVEVTGEVNAEVTMILENASPETGEAVDRATFVVNQDLAIASASSGISWKRSWDRVELGIVPPIAPHESREVRLTLRGVPDEVALSLPSNQTFAAAYGAMRIGTRGFELWDLSRSFRRRAVSPTRLLLRPGDLFPAPRYTPFDLAPAVADGFETVEGRAVPYEAVPVPCELDVDLSAPAGIFLADTCGNTGVRRGDRTRLTGQCLSSLAQYEVRGGPQVLAPDTPIPVAVLPEHRHLVGGIVPVLSTAATMAREALPGLDPFAGTVVLEWPAAFSVTPEFGQGFYQMRDIASAGKLLLVPEDGFRTRRPLTPEILGSQAVASQLLARRAVEAGKEPFFQHFYRVLARERLGAAGGVHATMEHDIRTPLIEARLWDNDVWYRRLPGVLVDIERRAGARALMEGTLDFVNGSSGVPGTPKELVDDISARAGISFTRTYEDYFVGRALPQLTLDGVTFARDGQGWVVTGYVKNLGDGESDVPLRVDTSADPSSTSVTVGSGGKAPFRIATAKRPRVLLLDPEQRTFRLVGPPVVDVLKNLAP